MYTILKPSEALMEIERSSFYAYFMPIKDEKEAKIILENIRKKHPKARHCCYAYNLQSVQKSSDDGEPKGTAGRPLLELLIKNQLIDVLIVVVRYFGGIKLGASRLLRTYVEAAMQSINKAEKYQPYLAYCYQITIHPSLYEILIRVLNEYHMDIEQTEFDEYITLLVSSVEEMEKPLLERFNGQLSIVTLSRKQKYR